MIQAYDNFLDSYQSIKDFSLSCEFKDEVNEVDGVTYPYICRDIPEDVRSEVFKKLSEFKGGEIESPTIFLRMSPGGVHVPHVAHTDISMGKFSFMLYLHDNGGSGTSLLRHRMTGISYSPMLDGFTKIIEGDMNNFDSWTAYQKVQAKENRAAIFDAGCIHRAEPVGGFGDTQEDSRIVLTCFFS